MLGESQFRGVQIYDVIQDKDLNYWFATNDGIFHFNYYQYEKIDCDKAKSNSGFNFVMGNDSSIYYHNLNKQVFRIKGREISLFYELTEAESGADISLAIADDGNLLIGARQIIVINNDGVVVNRFDASKSYIGEPYYLQGMGTMYHLSQLDTLLVYAKGSFTTHRLNARITPNSVMKFFNLSGVVYAIGLEDKQHYRFNAECLELIALPKNTLLAKIGARRIYETGEEAWVAGTLPGVGLFTNDNIEKGIELLYTDYLISNVYKDVEGNYLLSTFDKGVLVIPNLQVPDVIASFNDDPITAIYADKDMGLLLGSSKGKLYSYQNNTLTTINDQGKRPIEAIYGHPEGDFIIFDNSPIRVYSKATNTITEFTVGSLKSAVFASATQFYLGTNMGVIHCIWNGNEFSISHLDSLRQRIYSLGYHPITKLLYAATSSGLYSVDTTGIERPILLNKEELYPNYLHYYGGKVYAADKKRGILIIDVNQVIGIIKPIVKGKVAALQKIRIYQNTIIGSNTNGFFQFDMEGKLLKSIHNEFGFSLKKVMDFTFQGNDFWVSHAGGIQQIDLTYTKPQLTKPLIRVDNIWVNDLAIDFSAAGKFESNQRKIQFSVSAPTLKNRETIRYHHRLTPYEKEWNTNSYEANQITYNALAPGQYTLEVKAENEGLESEVVTYSFNIAPPYYATWWFITGLILLFLATVYILYRWQIGIQRRKSQQENDLNASKLTAIQSQMNPHFIFNSLNSIQDLILKGDVEQSYSYIATFSSLIRRTLSHSEKEFIDFEQEIKLIEIYLSLEKLRFKKDFTYNIETNDIGDIEVPPMLIQPFIENALLHGLLHKEGHKTININFELTEVLVCTIEDNGIGREQAKEIKERQRPDHESFSGKAIRTRLEILSSVFKGDFQCVYQDLYDYGEPSGTRVIITIPVKHKF